MYARPDNTVELLQEVCDPSRRLGLSRAASLMGTFSEHPKTLLRVLESIVPRLPRAVGHNQPPSPAERALYHTHVEVLLKGDLNGEEQSIIDEPGAISAETEHVGNALEKDREKRACEVLKQGWPPGSDPRYDKDHLLVLCQSKAFKQGSIFLFERMRRHDDVLRCYMDAKDYRGLLDAAVRLGREEPQLWFEVLSFLVSQDGDISAEVEEALHHIEKGRLLPPLLVLKTLSQNASLPLRVVKGYVGRAIEEETKTIEAEAAAVEKYRKDTAQMQDELQSMRQEAQIFQNNRCTLCQAPLDLPAVHFLCMHSYHQRCLGDSELECPQCVPEARNVMDIKRSLDASSSDQFFRSLETHSDPFSVVGEYFGRFRF